MHREAMHTTEELVDELEHEKRARQRVVAEAESQRRFAGSLDRLATAVSTSDNLETLLRQLLEMFVEAVHVDVAVIRLREGDRLRSRAAVGLEEEVTSGFSLPIDDRLVGKIAADAPPLVLSSSATDALCKSELIRQKGIRALHCLPLVEGDRLFGVVYMGTHAEREFTQEDQSLLRMLALRVTAAIVHHTTCEALQRAVRVRDDVLAVVAHDLQNPLNVISIAASTLLQRMPDSLARRPIERITRAAQRADRLIRDLLDISAIETAQFSIERQRMEPADLILSSLESQQNLAADASVIIASDLSPELPPIEADEERLLQVLENLIGNAVKFTPAGGSITVGADYRDGEIVVSVKDNGSGIAPDQLPHIFDRYWRVRTGGHRGTGLGLTISKAIVEAHCGRIWAESSPGHGTTMFFTIPAAPTRALTPKSPPTANILLVDDRPENLLSLKAILERPDYRLVTATSGPEALSIALRESFAVALIDIAMPEMNGLEVAIHLKELERSRDIPIIFITAFGDDPEEIHRAYSAGGADYLVKPLDTEIVRKKVAVFVDLSRRHKAIPA